MKKEGPILSRDRQQDDQVRSSRFQNVQPVSTVYAGPILYELKQAEEGMKWHREFITQAPDELNGFFAFLTVPPGPLPYPVVQSMFDALYPPGLQWYWRADFVNELSDAAIEQHVKHGAAMRTSIS